MTSKSVGTQCHESKNLWLTGLERVNREEIEKNNPKNNKKTPKNKQNKTNSNKK